MYERSNFDSAEDEFNKSTVIPILKSIFLSIFFLWHEIWLTNVLALIYSTQVSSHEIYYQVKLALNFVSKSQSTKVNISNLLFKKCMLQFLKTIKFVYFCLNYAKEGKILVSNLLISHRWLYHKKFAPEKGKSERLITFKVIAKLSQFPVNPCWVSQYVATS